MIWTVGDPPDKAIVVAGGKVWLLDAAKAEKIADRLEVKDGPEERKELLKKLRRYVKKNGDEIQIAFKL